MSTMSNDHRRVVSGGSATRQRPERNAGRVFNGDGASVSEPIGASRGPPRSFFERRFGWDFGQVRIHAGPEASAAADRLDARAFTVGRDIAFGRDEYAPDTQEGQRLLAHELAHVVQQSRGGAVPDPAGDGALERDADRAACAAVAGRAAAVACNSGTGIARQPKDDETGKPDEDPPFHLEPVRQDPAKPGPAWKYVPDHPSYSLAPLFRLEPPPALIAGSAKSPGDSQAGTPTGGLIPGNAQVQDKGDYGLTFGLSHPIHDGGSFAPGFSIAAGVADLGHDIGLELAATGGAPGGNSTSAMFLPHIAWAPKDRHLNFGAFGNVGVTGGTSPPGATDADLQVGGTLIAERPIGDRNRPVLLRVRSKVMQSSCGS